jgi:Fic family protein
MPNQGILISTLGLQEAKDSSAIENIVTTHDELFRDAAFPEAAAGAATKEVARYRQALRVGFDAVRRNRPAHQQRHPAHPGGTGAERSRLSSPAGHGTEGRQRPHRLHAAAGPHTVLRLMADLERFVNADELFAVDPLIKMVLIHHQFESIHPFYDGNGRTGRIVNVLYLVRQGLLDIPVLYMSRHIVRTKSEYYRLLQAVRERDV